MAPRDGRPLAVGCKLKRADTPSCLEREVQNVCGLLPILKCFHTVFFHVKSQLKHSPHVAPGVEPLNHGTWLQPNPTTTQPSRSLVAARLDATVYALDTEQLTLDRAIIPWGGSSCHRDPGMLWISDPGIVRNCLSQKCSPKRPPQHPIAQKCKFISCFCLCHFPALLCCWKIEGRV